MTDEDDFWDAAPATASLDRGVYGLNARGSRYVYPAPPGYGFPRGRRDWRRMTNLVSAFSDQERLQDWLTWKNFMGLRADEALFDEWMAEPLDAMDPGDQRELALKYAERARAAARADEGARRGTARHTMMDTYLTTGEITGTRSMRLQLRSALDALEAAELDVVASEFRVWHPGAGGAIGTSDVKVMCRRTGQVGILDWKTQARFWTFQEIAGQLYGYDSAPFVWDGPHDHTGRWIPQEANTLRGHPDGEFADRRVALVAHMPQNPGPGQLPVELYEVDMEYGRNVLETAARNVELRSVGASVAVGRRPGARRPVG